MGDVYATVTKMMLSGEVPNTFDMTKEAGVMFQPDMLDIAIRELGRCII